VFNRIRRKWYLIYRTFPFYRMPQKGPGCGGSNPLQVAEACRWGMDQPERAIGTVGKGFGCPLASQIIWSLTPVYPRLVSSSCVVLASVASRYASPTIGRRSSTRRTEEEKRRSLAKSCPVDLMLVAYQVSPSITSYSMLLTSVKKICFCQLVYGHARMWNAPVLSYFAACREESPSSAAVKRIRFAACLRGC
jgi:hypothetical protein